MLGCASEEGKWSGEYEIQDVFQLSLDRPALLTFDFIHFHHRHLSDLFCTETLPVNGLYPIHRRRSIPFDLSNAKEAQEAARALLGLLRFLQSGEAKIPVLRDSMRLDLAEPEAEASLTRSEREG
ncbi:hypothetical protein BCR35DRAFT_298628 [Leucosporidium creatinivorum]|uniref:Uncharacterized protein n=1 Tax=Leucosporidium creatinivorum TaxID=106004 RepID=A0A1Y2G258_9BASI|nr:hypothetical protein BCR35DRAFT_298628 [Leucosporidium creatinivorum]